MLVVPGGRHDYCRVPVSTSFLPRLSHGRGHPLDNTASPAPIVACASSTDLAVRGGRVDFCLSVTMLVTDSTTKPEGSSHEQTGSGRSSSPRPDGAGRLDERRSRLHLGADGGQRRHPSRGGPAHSRIAPAGGPRLVPAGTWRRVDAGSRSGGNDAAGYLPGRRRRAGAPAASAKSLLPDRSMHARHAQHGL